MAGPSPTITVHVPLTFGSRGACRIVMPETFPVRQHRTDNALVKALAQAYRWRKQIEDGEFASITELARSKGINESYACRLLRLTLLAPVIVTSILNGRHPEDLTLKELSKPFPFNWADQFEHLRQGARS